ncbi:MAG: ABC transporter ATP-binding protein, partial [Ferrovibrionaceae bacterium]
RARIAGAIRLNGRYLLTISEREMQAVRGNEIGMIFQEPMTSLNPVMTVGEQVGEGMRLHLGLSARAARTRAIEMLELVGIPAPEIRVDDYPHQMSGGMRQRVMIAMALACEPKLLIADEPTTALDVTIQAQILDLLRGLVQRLGTAVILISHDLGVVRQIADRVIVMYAGRKIEEAPTASIFDNPRHPYTRGLMRAMPRLGSSAEGDAQRLNEIPGQVPSLRRRTTGCLFAARCDRASDRCHASEPAIREDGKRHFVACHHLDVGQSA